MRQGPPSEAEFVGQWVATVDSIAHARTSEVAKAWVEEQPRVVLRGDGSFEAWDFPRLTRTDVFELGDGKGTWSIIQLSGYRVRLVFDDKRGETMHTRKWGKDWIIYMYIDDPDLGYQVEFRKLLKGATDLSRGISGE